MYELEIEIEGGGVAEEVFKVLEREVKFARGSIKVAEGGGSVKIVCRASDVTSLRSLANTAFRALYVIRGVESI